MVLFWIDGDCATVTGPTLADFLECFRMHLGGVS